MKKYISIFITLLLISCDKKRDFKTFTDNTVTIETFTIIPDQIQGSAPNTSFIKIEKDGETKDLMTYDSFGVNNVSVTFNKDSIIIKGLDEQTSGLLNRADLKIKNIFGYKISVFKQADT